MSQTFSKTFAAVLGFLMVSGVSGVSASAADIQTVAKVDPVQFTGTWYEIAAGQSGQAGDRFCGREVFAIRHDGKFNILESYNSGTAEGALTETKYVANPIDVTNSKLSVSLSGNADAPPTDFWVIGIDAKYRYVVVTDRDGSTLSILSKTPRLSQTFYKKALQDAQTQLSPEVIGELKLDSQNGCSYPAP